MSAWGSANNLQLNTSKTKEIIIDFRRHSPAHAPLHINGDCVERVPSCKFLGTCISQELSWSTNTTAIKKKAEERLHFLRILRKKQLEQKLLVSFYRSTIESVLTYCITARYAGSSAADRTALQRVIDPAQKITGCQLPSLEELASFRCRNRTRSILKDAAQPAHHLFDLLPDTGQ